MSEQEQDNQYRLEAQPVHAEPSGLPVASPRILVVEDEPLTRKAVGRKLQNAGFEVIMTPTAGDALILAHRLTFQVLVLDLNLPDDSDPFFSIQDGFALLDWLRRQL